MYHCRELAAKGAREGEALELDDEHWRQPVDGHADGCIARALALWTVPACQKSSQGPAWW